METDGKLNEAMANVLWQIKIMAAKSLEYKLFWLGNGHLNELISFADAEHGEIHIIGGNVVDVSALDPGWVKANVRIFKREDDHDWTI